MLPEPIEILPDLYFIQRGYLNANHFAYQSRDPVLIDTAYRRDWRATEDILVSLGLDLERISLIINTHTHCDHIGGNRIIQERSGCGIALHPRGAQFMRDQDGRSPWWSYYHQEADYFEATIDLEDGQSVQVGPYNFLVIHTPGHASDGLVLYNSRERLLLSSDTLWENDFPVMTLAIEGSDAIETMLASLGKIADLKVDRLYPGHGAPFHHFQKALKQAADRLERFQQDPVLVGWDVVKKIIVYTMMMKGRVASATFYDDLMSTEWFPDTINRYFSGDYRPVFDQVMADFLHRGIILKEGSHWVTTITP